MSELPPPPGSRRRWQILGLVLGASVLIGMLVTLQREGVVFDFGSAADHDGTALPVLTELWVSDVDRDVAPPLGSVLTDGGWAEASAFIARSSDAGRPVIINLFASWCRPCEREMPLLNQVAAREAGIDFLGVAHLDARRDAERFVTEQQVVFTTILDLDGAVAAAVGGRGLPVTVAFDEDGVMVGQVFGELTDESLESLLGRVR